MVRVKRLSQGIVMLALLLAPGCASTHIMEVRGKLTRTELEQKGLIIGAVTALGGGEFVFADLAAGSVEKQFRSVRPWLRVISLTRAKKHFDPAVYRQTLKQISENLTLSPGDFTAFNSLSNEAGYVLLINIQPLQDREGSVYVPYVIPLGADNSKAGISRIEYRSLKTVIVFSIFDLETQTMVWAASAASGKLSVPSDEEQGTAYGMLTRQLLNSLDRAIPKAARHLPRSP